MAAGLSISRAWDETKARIAADGRLFATVAAALMLLPEALVTVLGPPEELSGVEPAAWVGLLGFLSTLIGLIGQIAIIRLAQTSGLSVSEAIAHGAKRFLPVIGAILILAAILSIITIVVVLIFGGAGDMQAIESGTISPGLGMAVLAIVVLGLLIAPKFLMMMPVASAEAGGPLHILKRSWSISGGHYLRLFGFVLLILLAAVIVVLATQIVLGAVLVSISGELEALSFGALLFALIFAATQAAFAVVFAIMSARIYAQLVQQDGGDVSVPKSGT